MSEKFQDHPNNRFENWIAYRESENFRRGIKSLEALNCALQNKVAILATALNIKKASQIEFDDTVSVSDINKTLSDLGLFFL